MKPAERAIDVTCYGQICIDHIFHTPGEAQPRLGRETFAESYSTAMGGGGGIVAVTLARLGMRGALVSRVGADAAGQTLIAQLQAERVDIGHVEVLEGQSTDISVAFTGPSDRGFLSHVAASKVLDDLPMDSWCLALSRHLHLCLSPTDDPAHWRGLVRQAHEVGTTVSIDLGWQPQWDRRFCEWLGEADIVFPNEAEALRLAHTRSLDRAMRLLGERGATVVVKRGGRGAAAFRQGVRLEMPACPVSVVRDTTGAGDMFVAGFLWAHLQGRTLCASLAAGNLCGARCVEQTGGVIAPPSREELMLAMTPYDPQASL